MEVDHSVGVEAPVAKAPIPAAVEGRSGALSRGGRSCSNRARYGLRNRCIFYRSYNCFWFVPVT
jgi:hypothetical protein